MFQNISKESEQEFNEEIKVNKKEEVKEIFKKLFTKQNIILYIITFMVSMVNISSDNVMFSITPFGIAIIAAALSSNMPVGIMYAISLISTFIKFGPNSLLTYILTTLVFFVTILIKRPKIQDEVNEQKRLGMHLFISTLIVQVVPMFFRSFILYELLTGVMLSISTYIFYKIFSNSITVIREVGIKKVFSIEEVIGTSLLLTIAFMALGDTAVFGYSVKNILSILLVLILGWKNGILVGATSGITIGVVLGIIGNSEPIMIASYAISGMIAGIFNKFGKIGVILGFIIGNVLLTYVANGNTVPVILIQEILIASLGLLAIPKGVQINIEDLVSKTKMLPETTGKTLEENKETVYKLTSMSQTISDMAKSYQEAAATIVSEEELKEQELSNEKIFIDELRINLEGLEENILYDDIYNDKDILKDIFEYLLKEEIMVERELVKIFANHNNYIVGFEEKNKKVEEEVSKITKVINYSYRISKMNFIWKKKMDESKKNVSNQLEGVSEAISNLANEISKNPDEFEDKKQEILTLLEQKEIKIKDISIKKQKSGRFIVDIYADTCDNLDGTSCDIKKIGKILNKVFNDKFIIQDQQCGLRENKQKCKFTYIMQDKLNIQIGVAKTTKADSPVSGDSNLQTKLDDGKYLLALSDGMGSGPEARKSSKIAIKMLERLLEAGFDKDISIKLINSTLIANLEDDMYATLDIAILDLFKGNLEFIKNGACPTFVKRNKEIQILKSLSLPTGIVENADLTVYDYDLQPGDILVMCTDGIIESNTEYVNKELWVKYLLEDIQTNDAQQIADLILSEAIDNNYGKQKDDMTVIVAKVSQ
ncbi:stage II sporulation protein E protein serine/threonine phosphatase [Clostridium sp. CAG:798]|jgi:stage II sporulation protein E|nr:stage II sporulation protein E protein serine/threonine phosphatase [Clostridium sp. CAG:798]